MAINKVWQKDDLPRGDLQLLEASHASGVLRLTQSNYAIDQTTYFRTVVFSNLIWKNVDGKEMAKARFKLVILGQDKGSFVLDISHKPSWESNQSNYTTGLHWGGALGWIQDEQLIGRTLSLYQAVHEPYDYLIDIS